MSSPIRSPSPDRKSPSPDRKSPSPSRKSPSPAKASSSDKKNPSPAKASTSDRKSPSPAKASSSDKKSPSPAKPASSSKNPSPEQALDAAKLISNPPSPEPENDHLYKILVIGDIGCGKTSIIQRYVHDFFTHNYRSTIGVDFALKIVQWDSLTRVRLQLWDIAGQERFGNMTRIYYKEAFGAFVVFDVTRSNTFDSVARWKNDLDSKVRLPNGAPIPCVLLANKCDQPKEGPVDDGDEMEIFCIEHNFAAWFETSAKENINIDDAAKALIRAVLHVSGLFDISSISLDDDKFLVTEEHESVEERRRRKCSC